MGQPKPERIKFPPEEKAALVGRLQGYFEAELDRPLGRLAAEMLLEFLEGDIGAFYYNRGLADAQAALRQQIDQFDDVIYGLERLEALRQ